VTVDSIIPSVGSFADPLWTVGDLALGASATLTVQLTVDPSTAEGTDVISDTAAVTAVNETDTDIANDSVTESTSVEQRVDLAVSKTESADPVLAGSATGNLTYVVTVTNNGLADATGVVLAETLILPSGVSVDSITPSAGSFADPLWTVGSLASGASATLTVQLTVDSSTTERTDVISATAAVVAVNEIDADNTNDSATESTSVTRQVDLAVSETESADPVLAGSATGNLTYVVTITNHGPSDASGVVLIETLNLPSGVTVDSIIPSVGTFVDPLWTVGDLTSGTSATLTVQLTVDSSTAQGVDVISDTNEISAVDETDTDNTNDSVTESTSVVRQVDLAVSKTESADPVLAGSSSGNLMYVVTVTNNGPSDASGVALTEFLTLPSGVTVDSITPSAGTFADPLWTVGDLTASASATLTVQLTVGSSTTPGTDVISDTATVTAVNENDTDNTNDSAAESTSVEQQVDLAVSKSESVDPVIAGSGPGNLTYVVTVTNNGPSDASGVALTESLTLPSGVTVDSITPSVGSFADPLWTVGNLTSGVSATLTVRLTVGSSSTPGTDMISDTATVVAVNETDSDSSNDTATESTSVAREVDLVVSKSESVDPVVAGSGTGNLTYVVTVTNDGPSNASGVALTESLTLPSGVTVDSITPSVGSFADPLWTVGDLVSGANATLTVQLTVDTSTAQGTDVISFIATVTAVNESELDASNNSATEPTSVERRVDLAVAQTESADPVLAGSGTGNLTHVVTVTNNGPSDASAVVLTESLTLPSGVTVDSITPSVGIFADPLWTVGDLASGASATLTVQLTVDSSTAPGTDVISDTATVVAVNETDTESSNDSATESTSVAREVDLAVAKTESSDPVIAGSGSANLTYVVTVTNHGPSDASGVVLTESPTLPSGVTVDSTTSSVGTFLDPLWTVGDLVSGASATLTVQLTVGSSTVPGTDVITNTATVTAVNETDTNSANNSAFESTSVVRQVDLAASTTESIDPVIAGSGAGNLTYVATVTNHGPADATGVAMIETLILPSGVTVDSITPSVGIFADPVWTVGDLASGASATLTVELTVDASTAQGTDVVSFITTVTAVNESELDATNNSATETTSVVRLVDLAVSKTESADPVIAGSGAGNLIYVVTVTNSGPSDASGVELTESLTLPSGVTVDSITPSVGSFVDPVWTVGDLASGASETLTIQLTVGSSTPAGTNIIGDTTTVTAVNETDSNSTNDGAAESTSVERQVDLAVSKSESIDPVLAGSGTGNLTYVATVTNNGPSDASGVELTESLTLPSGVTVDSITPSAGTFADPTWTLGDLASGASATLTVQLTVGSSTAPATDVISNTTEISAVNETDTDGSNDSATESTSVERRVDLAVSKTESADPVFAGSGTGNLTYVATVTNFGPSDASGVELTETLTLPSGVTVDSITPSAGTFVDPTWTLGDLASGASATLTVQLTVDASTAPGSDVISSTAEVTAVNETDTDSSNDSATESTSVVIMLDYGDAPDPTYPTLEASGGAKHILVPGGPVLGAGVDAEADGQPTAGANGDDADSAGDDDDGVAFTSSLELGPDSTSATLDITATGSGLLNAWIDFNADGDWDDPDEQIFINLLLADGVNHESFTSTADAVPGPSYARFRISSTGGLSPSGSAPDGEVEDYAITITPVQDLDLFDRVESGQRTFWACNSITAGDLFQVLQGADLTLHAGNFVTLLNDFSTEEDNTFTILLGSVPGCLP
jgi:uncharacterized repeat protein (TIGR01451 family)